MRLIATEKAHQNRALLDPWSVVHFGTGLAAGLAEVDQRVAMGAAIAYEFVEQDLERREIGQELFETSGPENPANAVADVVLFAAGYVLGRLWNRTARD
jgi:hypothetical protein